MTLCRHRASRQKSQGGTIPAFARSCRAVAAVGLLVYALPAGADRNVLAPRGLIAVPDSLKLEYAFQASNHRSNLGWLTVGMPSQLYGLELEVERSEPGGRGRETFSLQYSLTGNAFSDLAPSISVGLRDVLRRGRDGQALFLAATKTLGLSQQQERLLRDWKLHVGYGSSRLGGPFIGMQGRFSFGPTANVEYAARRFNSSVALPVSKYLNLKAYTLDGDLFYGASFVLVK
jgi:hypothetical protein